MKESDKKAICELAGVEYFEPADYKGNGEGVQCMQITLEILTKAMVNYNLSKGEYRINNNVWDSDILIFGEEDWGNELEYYPYTSIETYTESLKKALIFVVGGEE